MEIVCHACQSVNRIPEDKPAELARCGKCKSPIFPQHPIELNAQQFEKLLTRDTVPLLVDFWASWCGPCRMMAPQFEVAAHQLQPKVRLAKLNTERENQIAARYRVQSIPTIILFDKGKELARQAGAMNADQIVRWVHQIGW